MDRLQAQEKLLTDVGHEKYIFEDFAEHLYDIYRRLASCILSVEGDGILLQSFNDEIASSYIITHLKVRLNNPVNGHAVLKTVKAFNKCMVTTAPGAIRVLFARWQKCR